MYFQLGKENRKTNQVNVSKTQLKKQNLSVVIKN